MAEPASNLLVLIVRKAVEFANKHNWVARSAEWLGIVDDDAEYEDENQQEYEVENYSLRKWSTAWFAHRMQPANKIAWAVIALYVIAIWTNLIDLLPRAITKLPTYSLVMLAIWLVLRWFSKQAKPQTSTIAISLRVQARGALWWGLLMTAYYAFIYLAVTVSLYIF